MRRDGAVVSGPLLQLQGIEKRYGGVRALRGLDFDLRAGEVRVLPGENGAGKITLMGVISEVFLALRTSVTARPAVNAT